MPPTPNSLPPFPYNFSQVDGFMERWNSRMWVKDIAALRFAPALDTKVYVCPLQARASRCNSFFSASRFRYKHGSCADYLIFACVLLQGSRMCALPSLPTLYFCNIPIPTL